ncbi:MAG: alpha/beta fold hydrolase [Symbiobacteriia bacterium]
MYLRVNGCNHYLKDTGPKGAQAILTLHGGGGMGDSRAKRQAFGPLDDKYRVVTFDARGCGRSEEVGTPSYEQWCADAEAIRQELGLGKVIVAGGSSGGFLALEYVLRYPDSCSALILRGTGAVTTDNEDLKRRVREAGLQVDWDAFDRYWTGHALSDEDMKEALWQFYSLYPAKGTWDPVEGRKKLDDLYFHHKAHNYTIQVNWKDWDLRPRLGEIKVPTLIVVGEQDWVKPIENSIILRDGIPNSRLEVFEGCGHGPHTENTPKFVATVRDFLASNGL